MDYVYPAIFQTCAKGGYAISFPDLSGCYSQGDTLPEAMRYAQWALAEFLEYLSDKAMPIPAASHIKEINVNNDEFVSLVYAKLNIETGAEAVIA